MNLIVDQGNTVCKLAICQADHIVDIYTTKHLTRELLVEILGKYAVRYAIYSSVGAWEDDVPALMTEYIRHLWVVDKQTPVPISVAYDRTTLGSDRLAAVVGAEYLSPGCELLVIDAGTAITYERVSADGLYLGGNISPGLHVRLKSLHGFTSRLPLLDDMDYTLGYGLDTISAMQHGVALGVVYEIEGYINSLRRDYPELKVYLTGGDADQLAAVVEMTGVELSHDLVLLGLNRILEYNKQCLD